MLSELLLTREHQNQANVLNYPPDLELRLPISIMLSPPSVTFLRRIYKVDENGSASDVITTTWELLWSMQVTYEVHWSELETSLPNETILLNDSFTYSVVDENSSYSVPAMVSVSVIKGLWALPTEGAWQCYEDTDCDVYFYAYGIFDKPQEIFLNLVLPPIHGEFLVLSEGNITSKVEPGYLNDVIGPPYNTGVPLIFRPIPDVFTVPLARWNDTMRVIEAERYTYYASIIYDDVVISSPIELQRVQIRNVLDYPDFYCPNAYHVLAAWLRTNDWDPMPDKAFIGNFSFEDMDDGVDPIMIEISTGLWSSFTLDPNVSEDILDRSFFCDSANPCYGGYTNSVGLRFKAQPVDSIRAMNTMMAQHRTRFDTAHINITLRHGVGSVCMTTFKTSSLRPKCKVHTCTVKLHTTYYYFEDDALRDDIDRIQIPWYYALLAFLCCLLCTYQCFCILLQQLIRLVFWSFKCIPCRILIYGRRGMNRVSAKVKNQEFATDLLDQESPWKPGQGHRATSILQPECSSGSEDNVNFGAEKVIGDDIFGAGYISTKELPKAPAPQKASDRKVWKSLGKAPTAAAKLSQEKVPPKYGSWKPSDTSSKRSKTQVTHNADLTSSWDDA